MCRCSRICLEICCTTRVSVYDLSCCIRRHEASSASSHVNPPSIRSLSQTTSHTPTTLRYSSRVGRTVSLLSFSLSLCHKVATDYMFQIIEAHPHWPVYADVLERPPPRLASRRSIWPDITSVDTIMQWREDWSSASVINHTTVTDPTIRQPGFNLPHHTWSLINRFRTGLSW